MASGSAADGHGGAPVTGFQQDPGVIEDLVCFLPGWVGIVDVDPVILQRPLAIATGLPIPAELAGVMGISDVGPVEIVSAQRLCADRKSKDLG